MRFLTLILAAMLLLPAGFARAGAREALAAFTKDLKGLDGQFSQQVFDVRGKQKESASGRLSVSAPSRLRWEYVRPYPQLIVADGKTVWVFEPDLNQVSKRPQGVEEANSPLALLLEPSRLERGYLVKEAGVQGEVAWLEITPRNADASFKRARLGFAGTQLVQMAYVDALGQRTEIRFSGWKRNPVFARDTFSFSPPAGVDVIGN